MATSPSTLRLNHALEALQAELELTDAQLAALPPLSEVDLLRQNDSHMIQHAELTPLTYHSYKLFIGESHNDLWHVYLYRSGNRRQYTMEITSVDLADRTHYEPCDTKYYGDVKNLAYPYNTFLGAARFVAVVKWYFTLGFRVGLYDEDPGFLPNITWRRELQGACDELIAEMESKGEEDEEEEEAVGRRHEERRRIEERERMKAQEAAKEAIESRRARASTTKTDTNNDRHTLKPPLRRKPASTIGYESRKDTVNQQLGQSEDHWPPRNYRNPKETSPPYPQVSTGGPQQIEADRHLGATLKTIFPRTKMRGERRQEDEEVAARKNRLRSQETVATNEQSTGGARSKHATDTGRLKAFVGSAEKHEHDQNRNTASKSRSQNVKRLAANREEQELDEGSTSRSGDMERALREEEYVRLYRQRETINRRLRTIEHEMSVEERLAMFKKVEQAS